LSSHLVVTFDLWSALLANHFAITRRVENVLPPRIVEATRSPIKWSASQVLEQRDQETSWRRRTSLPSQYLVSGASRLAERGRERKREREREREKERVRKRQSQYGKEKERNREPFYQETRETAGSSFADKSRDLFRELLRKLIRRSDSSVSLLDSNLQQAFHHFCYRLLDFSAHSILVTDIYPFSISLFFFEY